MRIRFVLPVRDCRRRIIEVDMRRYLKQYPVAMKVQDIAKTLACSRDTIYDWIRSGELISVRKGRNIFVPKAALITYLIDQRYYIVKKKEDK